MSSSGSVGAKATTAFSSWRTVSAADPPPGPRGVPGWANGAGGAPAARPPQEVGHPLLAEQVAVVPPLRHAVRPEEHDVLTRERAPLIREGRRRHHTEQRAGGADRLGAAVR